jgi:hypothetical protein
MPSANRCPECRDTIHPFAATCPSCGADLDAHRRRRLAGAQRRRPTLALPQMDRDLSDNVVIAIILVLIALFAPLFGAVFSLLVFLHANHNGLVARRYVAMLCAALAIFNLIAPTVLLPHILF